MTRTIMTAIAVILLNHPALSETPEQIRAKLLAAPEWKYEWATPLGQPDPHGAPGKCDNEVTLRVDGFNMENCGGLDLQFVASGNEFKATGHGYPYDYTIRPLP